MTFELGKYRRLPRILAGAFVLLIWVWVALSFSSSAQISIFNFDRNTDSTTGESTEEVVRDAVGVTEVDDDNIVLVFGGDVMLARTVEPAILYSGFDPLVNLHEIFQSADFSFVNLEYVASTQGSSTPGKLYTFRADPQTLDVISAAGIDAVSVANNHAGDYGMSAFLDMLENLKERGIGYLGGGKDVSEAYQPMLVDLGDVTLGLVAFNKIEIPYFAATDSRGGIAWIDEQRLVASIVSARESADFVVVLPHWGWEYTDKISPDQERLGRLSIDAGADMVIGGHPHHVQGSEAYKGGYIFYSMGNLVFDGPGPAGWYDGQLVEVTLSSSGEFIGVETIDYRADDAGLVSLK